MCACFYKTFEDSKIFSSHRNLQNLFLIQGLSEDICQLIISLHMVDEDIALEDMVPKKMMTNLGVLGLRVLYWVVCNLDCTLIVAVERHILHVDAIVLECLLHP